MFSKAPAVHRLPWQTTGAVGAQEAKERAKEDARLERKRQTDAQAAAKVSFVVYALLVGTLVRRAG